MTEPSSILPSSRSDLCSGRFDRMPGNLMEFSTQLAGRLADAAPAIFAAKLAAPTPETEPRPPRPVRSG